MISLIGNGYQIIWRRPDQPLGDAAKKVCRHCPACWCSVAHALAWQNSPHCRSLARPTMGRSGGAVQVRFCWACPRVGNAEAPASCGLRCLREWERKTENELDCVDAPGHGPPISWAPPSAVPASPTPGPLQRPAEAAGRPGR